MKTNTPPTPVHTHEGGIAQRISPYLELRRTVMTCLLWENTFYEGGNSIAKRIATLVPQVEPRKVLDLAISARNDMQLRHVPLFLLRELVRVKGNGPLVEEGLANVIQRADELGEFLAMYWKDKKQPIAASVKRGLAAAFTKFDAYRLAKYNREAKVKLKDVMFMVHPTPLDAKQAAVWKQLIDGTLESPDTWEVALSGGGNKKETFERLLREKKLGGLAVLRNLRNMQQSGVDEGLIRERLGEGINRALPFRFITAARYAPTLEDAIEGAMFKGLEALPMLSGKTGLLIDVSGSMNHPLSGRGETLRIDAANGLAVMLREKCQQVGIATFSTKVVPIPPRRGFGLRDAIRDSQPHGATYLAKAITLLGQSPEWKNLDRFIVITDEQSQDGIAEALAPKSYLINVASYRNGVSYGNGFTHIDGWSERVVDYVMELEAFGDGK